MKEKCSNQCLHAIPIPSPLEKTLAFYFFPNNVISNDIIWI